MDPDLLGLLLFSLLMVGMLGGMIILFPITRRLGAVLEQRLRSSGETAGMVAEVRKLQVATESLRRELEQLSERQRFTEALLGERSSLLLPRESAEPGASHPSVGRYES